MQKLKRSDLWNSLRKTRVSVMEFSFLMSSSVSIFTTFLIIKLPLGNLGISWWHEVKCLNSQEFQIKFLLRTNYAESHSLESLKQRKTFRQLMFCHILPVCCKNRQPFITAKKQIMVRIRIHELFAQVKISCVV